MMDAKYFAEIKARCDDAESGEIGAIADSQKDVTPLLAEVERLTAENQHNLNCYVEEYDNAKKAKAENATLKKALELACDSKFHYMPKPDYFIQQAQKQEGKK